MGFGYAARCLIELKAPVEYTYFIDLKEKWEFRWEEKDSSILIIAPAIQSGTPAVDVSKIEIYERKESFLRDVFAVKEKLRSELSNKLKYVAVEKISFIRETARKETKRFMYKWFLKYYFKDSEFKPDKIFVYFSGESISSESINTIEFEHKE